MLTVAEKYGEIDDNFLGKLMISFGIPLEESYLRYRLSVLMKEENNSLRKGRLYIPDSYNLMGTADPTGTLKEDEVCVILYVSFSGRARIQKTISDIKLCWRV